MVRNTKAAESFTELTGVLADRATLRGVIDPFYPHGPLLLGVELLEEASRGGLGPIPASETRRS